MLDKLTPKAEELAEEIARQWIGAFDAALAGGSESALSARFESDSHWRNLFGISWHFATFSGRPTLCRELLRRARQVGARGFRIDTAALARRRAALPRRGPSPPRSISTASVRTARAASLENPTRAISPRPTGASSDSRRQPVRIAIPTCLSSAAAMPAFRPPSS